MDRTKTVLTPERYASGMTFEQYLAYVASPENLRREGSPSSEPRRDWSGWMRSWYESAPAVRRPDGGRPVAGGPAGRAAADPRHLRGVVVRLPA